LEGRKVRGKRILCGRFKVRQLSIPFGENRIRQGPRNSYRTVIPADSPGEFWRIELGHLVEYLAIVSQTLKPVSESSRNIELATIVNGKLKRFPFSECGRVAPDVDKNIKDCSGDTTNEFDFRFWCDLVVESTEHPALPGQSEITLGPMSL
jgi:hypothetical protein